MTLKLTRQDLEEMLKGMSPEEMLRTLELMEELDTRKRIKICQDSLPAFVMEMQPDYKMGMHLKKLYSLLEDVEMGHKDRILVNMAPRFGKSQSISIYFPAWYLGNNPTHKIIIASHTADLAVDFLRKIRNLMQTEEYRRIFPGVQIATDAKAAGKWNTNQGGEAFAVGVGGALAGRGAHLLIVDDPFNEQDIINGNYEVFEKVYEWFTYGARTRLMPGGRVAILHCLAGDTQVMLENGSAKAIRDIRPGDMVASYDHGCIRSAKVTAWANQGLDRIVTIALKSGNLLRGNERHPFLVNDNGVEKWIKIKDLKPGMLLVATKDVNDLPEVLRNLGCAEPARSQQLQPKKQLAGCLLLNRISLALQKVAKTLPLQNFDRGIAGLAKLVIATIGKTLTLRIDRLDAMENGKGSSASQKGVVSPQQPWGSALPVMASILETGEKSKGWKFTARKSDGKYTSRLGTGSTKRRTWLCTPRSVVGATSAMKNLMRGTPRKAGRTISWLLTTAIRLVKYALSCAIPATSSLKTATALSYCKKPLSTLSITLDEILSVTADAEQEDVFDITVEGTENFLANGVVSHNTRWSLRDLTARLLKDSALNQQADQYELFEFPAILNEGEENEKSLWPEQWPLEALLRTKASMPTFQWNAQYMQNPTNADSGIVVKDWFNVWEKQTPPKCEFILMALDAAVEAKKRSDFNALTTWGVWFNEDTQRNEIILLNSLNFRAEFPELKDKCRHEYEEWKPDCFIIEQKANGAPLIQEFRNAGVYLQAFVPHRGTGDKIARLGAVADIIRDGAVWVPQTRWAEELVDQVAAFPGGDKDDLCLVGDTLITMADGHKKPICEVAVGEMVRTPFGARRVLESGCTGEKEIVFRGGLKGTAGHLVMTKWGWMPLGDIPSHIGLVRESDVFKGSLLRRVWLRATLAMQWLKDSIFGLPNKKPIWAGDAVRPVYNLKVEGCPWYFANGTLVHNCDSMTMALARFRQGGFLSLSSDEDEDDTYYANRVAKYY